MGIMTKTQFVKEMQELLNQLYDEDNYYNDYAAKEIVNTVIGLGFLPPPCTVKLEDTLLGPKHTPTERRFDEEK